MESNRGKPYIFSLANLLFSYFTIRFSTKQHYLGRYTVTSLNNVYVVFRPLMFSTFLNSCFFISVRSRNDIRLTSSWYAMTVLKTNKMYVLKIVVTFAYSCSAL